jgi:uncharacterized protein (TIGR02271 family)
MDTRVYEQVHEGMDVLDIDGDRIGKAGEVLGDGQYFNVDAGFLGTKEYYVPFSAVRDVSGDAVYLNVDKDDLDAQGWDQRPAERQFKDTGAATDSDTMQLREEQLQAHKTSVESGRVQLGKEIVEEQRTLDVPVSREEVYVERHPVERQPADAPIDETDEQTIRVPIREERVEVEKQPVVYEEVGVGKHVTQDTEEVSETVRREELRTNKEGEVDLRGDRNP